MKQTKLKLIRKIQYPSLGERPVEILESRLYQDQDTLQICLFLELENVSGKTVSGLSVDLCCFDDKVALISTRKQTYEGLEIPDHAVFGSDIVIPLPSLRTASVTATLNHVSFHDAMDWERIQTTDDEVVFDPEELAKTMEIPLPTGDLLFSQRKAQKKAEKELWKEKKPAVALSAEELEKKKRRKWIKVIAGAVAVLVLISGIAVGWRYIQTRDKAFSDAVARFDAQQYAEALTAFDSLEEQWFSQEQRQDILWYRARSAVQTGNYAQALRDLGALKGWEESRSYLQQLTAALGGITGAGERHSVGLKRDGTVLAAGDNSFGQCDTSGWTDMVAVTAGLNHTIGLKANGVVEAVGYNEFSQCSLGEWQNIIGISAGERHSAGVMNTGRVVAAGDNSHGQCDTQGWSGMVAVAAGRMHTVGLRQDGTVTAAGDNSMGACNVEDWRNIVSVAAGNGFTVGVRADGKVLAVGDNTYNECDVTGLQDVAAVAAGDFYVLALGYQGRLMTAGDNDWRQGEVALWKNLISAAGGVHHSIGVSQDGTVYAVGDNKSGQCEVWNWNNVGVRPTLFALE